MPGSKLAVVGAGSVGTSLAYAALIRGSASNIALFDLVQLMPPLLERARTPSMSW